MSAPTPSSRPAPQSVKVIARGGSGTVELAFRGVGDHRTGFRRMLAIKRLRPGHRDDPEARRAFLQEARITGELRHPNVVSVLDVGADQQGPFLLMDFVLGVSLLELREALAERGVALPVQLALRIGAATARALRAAHELTDARGEPMGLIHRDVSPGNVLVGFDGVVRLVDFGLARALEDGRTGELLRGTSGYVAPEQLRFEPLDARADLFALGVLLTELVIGERLYGDEEARLAAKRILDEPVPDLRRLSPDLSEPVAELLESLLAKDPAARPTGSAEVYRTLELAVRERTLREGPLDLQSFLATHLGDLIAKRRSEVAELWSRRDETARLSALAPSRRWWPWVLAATAAFGLGGASLAWMERQPDEARPPPPAPVAGEASTHPREPADLGVPPAEDLGVPTEESARPATGEPTRRRRVRRRRGGRMGRSKNERELWEW